MYNDKFRQDISLAVRFLVRHFDEKMREGDYYKTQVAWRLLNDGRVYADGLRRVLRSFVYETREER